MSLKLVLTGTATLQDEGAAATNVWQKNLADIFRQVTGVEEQKFAERSIVADDGAVALSTDGVSTIRALIVYVRSGNSVITVKHNSNTNGATGAFFMYANPSGAALASVTVETTATQAVPIAFLMVE